MAEDSGLKRIVMVWRYRLGQWCAMGIAFALTLWLAASTSAATLTFRDGLSGYSSTVDTELDDSSPSNNNGTNSEIELDDNPIRVALLRFDNIFGPGADQIPLGSTITSATLTVRVSGPSVSNANITLYRMLTGWSENSTWNSMGNGIQLDDSEASSTIDSALPNPDQSGSQTFSGANLIATLQAWSGGATNHGWAIFNDNDQPWKFYASDEPTRSFRPVLTVEFNGGGGSSTVVTNTNDSGAGSLRQALTNANAQSGSGTITFNIPLNDPNHYYYRDDGIANSLSLEATTILDDASIPDFDPDYPGTPHSWYRIQPVSAMPIITETVMIDGYTQPGGQINTVAAPSLSDAILKIEINGDAAAGDNLFLTQAGADFNEFRGLVINGGFTRPLLVESNNNIIAGNYIGTDVTGTQLPLSGNLISEHAVVVRSGGQTNMIGGIDPKDRNLIASSENDGVRIASVGSIDNVVAGNYIGTDITGTIALGSNTGVRIRDSASNNTIGGVGAAGNLIAGAVTADVRVDDSPSNTIQGNLIGTNASASGPISAPAQQGIRIVNSADTLIGGTFVGEGNVIAYHTEVGVQLDANAGSGTSILGNSIFSNNDVAPGTGLGIDLNDDGVTANDLDDLDTGANDLQNFPILTSANTDGAGAFYVGGVIHSTASRSFRIEVFANSLADPSGNGEGETYLGFLNVTTDPSGNAAFSTVFLATVPANAAITATATDQVTDDTSEFSPYVTAQDMGHVIVDTTSDDADAPDTSSITALLTNRGNDDLISLREAILATNNSPNLGIPDQIYFNIPDIDPGHVYYRDDGIPNSLSLVVSTLLDDASIADFDPDYPGPGHSWFRIQPTSDLPPITDAVSIDGDTQPGASANTLPAGNDAILLIELDGSNTTVGLHADTANVTLHGLVINQVPNDEGVWLGNGGRHVVAGNFIGTDITGTVAKGNQLGIKVDSPDNTIGGTAPADRNVISGNTDRGIVIETVGSTGNQVQGNFIGTDVSGANDLGNLNEGVTIQSSGNTIGGAVAGAANVISGNDNDGVGLSGSDATNNTLYGNFIGTDITGTLNLGNSGDGVALPNNAANNTIGGIAAGQANTIAFNSGDGIRVPNSSGSGNTIRGNAIHSNGSGADDLGIDIGTNGVNANDTGDGDSGPNGQQNFPVITSALTNETDTLTVDGTLNSISGTNFALDFFATVGESGEGAMYLGSIALSTDASGNASFNSIVFTPVTVPQAAYITATATVTSGPEAGNTSEFSQDVQTSGNNQPPTAAITLASYAVDEDTPLTLHGTGLSVSDPDAGTNGVEATLSVGEGTLAVDADTTGVAVNGSGTATVVLQGHLSQINNLLAGSGDATIFYHALNTPSPSTLLTLDINDLGHTGSGGAMSDSDNATLNITSENDVPVVTLPSPPANYDEGDVSVMIDAAATVTDPDSPDFDTGSLTVSIISGGTANDRLVILDQGVGPGHISLSGSDVRFGPGPVVIGTFSGGNGATDPLIINLNANADQTATQALIRNIAYDHVSTTTPSQARRMIEFELTDGDGGPGIPVTQTVVFNVRSALWLSAKDDTDPSDTNLPHWLDGDVVLFGLDATFGETTTSGLFIQLFALFFDNADQADLRAIHYVTRPITLGSHPNTFEVLPGDIIAGLDKDGTLQSTNSLAADRKDVFVFRPDSPGIYTSGAFTMLLENPVDENIHALTLVEEDVTFGDGTIITAGTFLLAHSNNLGHENVFTYQASGVGPGTTSGTELLLLDGNDLGFSDQIQGLELIEDETIIGDTTIPAARLLISLDKDNPIAGQAVTQQDIAILEVHGTEQSSDTSVTATLFFDGDNVALTENSETLDGLTIARNRPIVGRAPSVTNANTLEDNQSTSGLVITPHMDDGPEVTHAYITDITGGTLYQTDGVTPINDGDFITMTEGGAGLKFTPLPNSHANGSFTVQAATAPNTLALGVEVSTATITITPVGDTPSVTNATTDEDAQTTSGLVISRHPADGSEVTHFKITNIQGGTLYRNDGTTLISHGNFIDVSEGNSGLKFTPLPNSSAPGSFDVEASEDGISVAAQSGVVTATITVTPVADTPSATNATTLEDTQTASGLVISRNLVDGVEVTHFKITAISGGSLYQNDGVTPINSGDFITFNEGNAGLKFAPIANSNVNGSFNVQAATANNDSALGGSSVTATIFVTPVGDTPQASDITTDEDTQSGPIVLDRHPDDGNEVTHLRISNLTNGTLFQNDGVTPINHGDYILVAIGQAGLRFTPDLNRTASGGFDVEASENGISVAAQSGSATATITVTPVNDAPVLDNTGAMTLTDVIQDLANPPGNAIASIISSAGGDRITDVDSGAVEGIAVIGVDDTHGAWEYSINSGANWQSFVAVGVANASTDDTAAVLLDNAAHIRFVPNPGYTGPAGDLTFRAWDQTTGASGDTGVDVSRQGGATPYSLDTETASLSVIAVFGVTNLVPGAQTTDEDTPLTFSVTNGNPISVTDGSGADLPLRSSLAVTSGTLTLATVNGLNFEDGADGTSSMTISGLESAINAALDGLDYAPTDDYHGPESFQITTDTLGGLIAQYTFDDPGDPGHDDSPSSLHDATPIGGPTPIFDPVRGSDVLRFDGVDDHLQTPTLLGNPQQVTLAAWINMDAGFHSEALMSLGDNVAIRLDETTSLPGAGVHGYFYDGSTAQATVSNTFIAGTGWHHIAYTVDTVSQIQVLYIDGTAVASNSHSGAIAYSQGTDTYIGRHGVSAVDFLHGAVDDVRVYQRALSAPEVSSLFSGQTADTDVIAITVNPINDAPVLTAATPMLTPIMEDDTANSGDSIASILGASVDDVDAGAVEGIAITGLSGGNGTWAYSTNGGGNWTPIGIVNNANARLLAADASTRVRFQPNPNYFGNISPGITFRAWDQTAGVNGGTADTTVNGDVSAFSSATDTASIVVNAVGDTPQVASVSTLEDTQSGPIALDRHPDDGSEVTHFRISNIANGVLFQNDGTTPINNGEFILVAEGQAGLRFAPDADSIANGSFDVQASEDGSNVAAQSGIATATITITPVADTPVVTNASTLEDTQTSSGLFISRNPVDGLEVTHFKITAITGGTLFQNDGTTPINNGEFISVTQGNAGLKFTPAANATVDGSFAVQASTADQDSGLGGNTVSATITVTAVNDDPTAHAGGPYDIDEGGSVTLDASASTDIDSAALTYTWELDGDNSFDDATGISPTFTWAQLQSFGINDGDQSYAIEVRVADADGGSHTALGVIHVANTAPILSSVGADNVTVGLPYTLSLSANDPGDDAITSWVINWGDGTIETVTGNPSSVTHIYSENKVGFTYNILVSATDEDGTFTVNELVVPGFTTDQLYRFEATTGDFIQAFAATNGIDGPIEAIVGPDGLLYVSGEQSDDVLRYNATTGAFVDTFVTAGSGGLDEPGGLAFGPDGHLYVANGLGDSVLRYDGNSGTFIDAFVSPSSGGLDQPYDLIFGPDGHLYVASFSNHEVLRYNGNTGAFIDMFVRPGSGGLDTPEQMAFGPDANVYIASFATDQVLRYQGDTGEFIDVFVTAGLGGLDQPTGLAFGPDGDLYIGDFANSLVRRYNGDTGTYIDDHISAGSGGLATPVFKTFLPSQQVHVIANLPPTLSLSGGPATYIENGPPMRLAAAATLSDPDSPDFATGTLILDFASGGTANDRLDIHDQGPGVGHVTTSGIDVLYDFGSGPIVIGTFVGGTSGSNPLDIAFNANATTASVEAVLRQTTYHNVSDHPATDPRTVRFIVTDGDGGTSTAATQIINLTIENDDPSNTGTLPPDVMVTEDEVVHINLSAINLVDPDAELGNLTLTLATSTGGLLAASSSGGVAVSGSGTETLVLTGTVDALNAFIDNAMAIQYVGAPNASGDNVDRLTLHITDNGHDSSGGGGLIALGNIQVNITPVGDTPQAVSVSTLEDTQSDPIMLTPSPDDGGEVTHFRITNISGGTLHHTDGVSVINDGDFITVTEGSSGLRFTPDPNSIASGSFDVEASEDGLTVAAQSGVATITISITAENDPPSSISLSQNVVIETADSGSSHTIGTFAATDPDDNDTAVYSIAGGEHASLFAIGEANTLTLTDSTLDFETQPTYFVTIRVTDSGGATLDQTFAISVADVATTITTGQRFSVSETAAGLSPVGTVATTGDTPVRFTIISGNADNAFVIDAAGRLSLSDNAPIDFETTPSYVLGLEVSDGTSTVTATVIIDIIDVVEATATTDNGSSFNPITTPSNDTSPTSTGTTGSSSPAPASSAPQPAPTETPEAGVSEAETEQVDNTPPSPPVVQNSPIAPNPPLNPTPPQNSLPPQTQQRRPSNDSPRRVSDRSSSTTTSSRRSRSPSFRSPSQSPSAAPTSAPAASPKPAVIAAPAPPQPQTEASAVTVAPPETPSVTTPSVASLGSSVESVEFLQELDQLREHVHQGEEIKVAVRAGATVVTTGLSIGYVLWLLRGGLLLSSLLTSLPAWRFIDPLPVLAHLDPHADQDPSDDDALETVIKKGEHLNANQDVNSKS